MFSSPVKLMSQKKTLNSITWMDTPSMPCIKAGKLQVALLAAVKTTPTWKFHISKEINEADTKKLANMSDVLEGLLAHVTSVFCRYTSSYLQTEIPFTHWWCRGIQTITSAAGFKHWKWHWVCTSTLDRNRSCRGCVRNKEMNIVIHDCLQKQPKTPLAKGQM